MTDQQSFNAEELVSEWIKYWNDHDTTSASSFYDDNFEFYSPFLKNSKKYPDGKIKNKEALKHYFEKIIQNIPDLNLQVNEIKGQNRAVNLSYYSKSEDLIANASITFNERGKIEKSYFNFRKQDVFSSRIRQIPQSYIREILEVASKPDIISFAGGLPNPNYFPVEALRNAADKVLKNDGYNVLQYTTSEGYLPLREYIADRYKRKKGINVHPDEIIITNGSQQNLDLAAKLFINEGDHVLLEKPSYLGAIQAFSIFEPHFDNVELENDGVNLEHLTQIINSENIKLFYTVPNFQNPSGITYSGDKREKVSEIIGKTNTWIVEDDPYGEIRFLGEDLPPIKKYLPCQTILSGSFSKIIAPGLRMGWLVAPPYVIEKLIIFKQATDLHSNFFSQRVIYQYLLDNDLDKHINLIKSAYLSQRNLMVEMIDQYFPEDVTITKPEGGMFLWVQLPEKYNSIDLFKKSINEKVAFVPGRPFYTTKEGHNTFRLNFSNANDHDIRTGIRKLGEILTNYLTQH